MMSQALSLATDMESDLVSVSQASERASEGEVHEVTLEYPESWHAPINPHTQQVDRNSEKWFRGIGIIKDQETLRKFRSLQVGLCGGSTYPFASRSHLEIVAQFISLWIFYDDTIEGNGESNEEMIVDAVRGLPNRFPGGSPYYQGWWDLGQRSRIAMSDSWLIRHAERYRDWLHSVRREAEMARSYRCTGLAPRFDQYMDMRTTNIGLYAMIDFIELATGQELSNTVLNDPRRQEIERVSSAIVTIQNDLTGFSKDRQKVWPNAVVCAAQDQGISILDAFRFVEKTHNRLVASFCELERELLLEMPLETRVWLDWLRHINYGFARWHMNASRYRPRHDLGDGGFIALQLSVH